MSTPSAPLKRKLDAAETTLARLTRELATLDEELADPARYKADRAVRREAVAARAAAAEADWLTLAEQYEALAA